MSDTRERIFDYIVEFQAENTASPSLMELAEALGLGKSTVVYHIEQDPRLVRRGMRWIEVVEHKEIAE